MTYQQPPGGFPPGGGYPPPGGGYGQSQGYPPPAQPGPGGYPASAPYGAPQPPQGQGWGQPPAQQAWGQGGGHWADHIQNARVGGGGPPRVAFGDYVVQVTDVKEHRGFKGYFFIVNFLVRQSTNPQQPVNSQGSDQIQLDSRYPDMSLADVKGFAAAVLGIHPTDPRAQVEITKDVIVALTRAPTPVMGHIVGLSCYPHQKRGAAPGAAPFPRYRWSPILDAQGRPMREALQAPPPSAAPQGPPQGAPMGQPPAAQWGGPPAHPGPSGAYSHGGQAPAGPPGGYGPPPAGQWGGAAAGPGPTSPSGSYAPGQAYQPPPFQPPQVPQAPPAAPQFPPPGWTQHPGNPDYYYKGQECLSSADLRTAMAAGRA